MARMWVLEGAAGDGERTVVFRLAPGAIKTVGRAGRADFVLEAPLVSRLHCRLTASDDRVLVEDLGSTNGTFVNGDRVSRGELRDGDRVRFGRVELVASRSGRGAPARR